MMRTFLTTLIVFATFIFSCTNSESSSDYGASLDNTASESSVIPSGTEEAKEPETSEADRFLQSLSPSKKESLEKEIAKFAVCALYFKEPKEVSVRKHGRGYIAGYLNDEGIKRDTKIEIEGNAIKWGNSDGRWRTNPEDERVLFVTCLFYLVTFLYKTC